MQKEKDTKSYKWNSNKNIALNVKNFKPKFSEVLFK